MEIEYKWELPGEAALADLLSDVTVAPMLGDARELNMYATYYDTANQDVSRMRGGLRVRRENDESVCCLKLAAGGTDGCKMCIRDSLTPIAAALDRAGKEVGVNFIGGFSALVQKGVSDSDRRLINSIPHALSSTDIVCSSVNIGSTRAGINMDAVLRMAQVVRECAEITADRDSIACAKLVVFCNIDVYKRQEILEDEEVVETAAEIEPVIPATARTQRKKPTARHVTQQFVPTRATRNHDIHLGENRQEAPVSSTFEDTPQAAPQSMPLSLIHI